MTGRDRNRDIIDLPARTMGYRMSEASEGPDIRLQARVAELAASFEAAVVGFFDFTEITGYKFINTYIIYYDRNTYTIRSEYINTKLHLLSLIVEFRLLPRDEKWVVLGLKTDEDPGPSSLPWREFAGGGGYGLDLVGYLESRGVTLPSSVRVRFDLLAPFSENRHYTLLNEAIIQTVQRLGSILNSEIELLKQIQDEATRKWKGDIAECHEDS